MASIPSWTKSLAPCITSCSPLATAARTAELEELVRVIRSTPAIDNHANPLLGRKEPENFPLLAGTATGKGESPDVVEMTLGQQRALRQLATALQCEPSWDVVAHAIRNKRLDEAEYGKWVAKCLAGVDTILFDDESRDRNITHDMTWHDRCLSGNCRRIFSIETVAAEIIDSHARSYYQSSCTNSGRRRRQSSDDIFDRMLDDFGIAVKQAIENIDIVGFSSVIGHRTGLGIRKAVDIAAARDSFEEIVENYGMLGKFTTVSHAGLSDLFVHHTAVLIREYSTNFRKPIQFHTFLGGTDASVVNCNPALLEKFIRAYPVVPIVLLNACYPYAREAGCLASTHANVHVDIGKIFPSVSQGGQETVLREMLELCPWSKILWGTGANDTPESFLLANIQGREALKAVLCELVWKGHISCKDAVDLSKAVLFENSNRLYNLELSLSSLLDSTDGTDTGDETSDDDDDDDDSD
ncbi:hypothetical protein MCOR25_011043 [Pyricularia grisea]|uniref:Amidohydrolase-related domain-containing protein n=1 Tax=Pyricularia grisea TaxID=148305 RepID=A0A6P8AVG0_PYRGI|nr:uncharacterized protein PgNI_08308 [Pyricularia grisea]KAI6345291.1 hypothetical protein MCOR25_011043 [Pyricularia grisea]TLD06213.1 hypothetical protein PgNI_08308 [Pyricularia grisea]